MTDFEKNGSTIYMNADIITLNDKFSSAQAMLIEDGIIINIGTNDEILPLKTYINGNQVKNLMNKFLFFAIFFFILKLQYGLIKQFVLDRMIKI